MASLTEEWPKFRAEAQAALAKISEGVGDFGTCDSTSADVVEWVGASARELSQACDRIIEHLR